MSIERSMIEVAEDLMQKKKKPQNIHKFMKEVAEIKGIDADDAEKISRLYLNITTSAKFVFCGEDEWDLKERHKLALWEKDGSYFNTDEEKAKAKEEIKKEKEEKEKLEQERLDKARRDKELIAAKSRKITKTTGEAYAAKVEEETKEDEEEVVSVADQLNEIDKADIDDSYDDYIDYEDNF